MSLVAQLRSLLLRLLADARKSSRYSGLNLLLFGWSAVLGNPRQSISGMCFVGDWVFALPRKRKFLLAQLLALLRTQISCHDGPLPTSSIGESTALRPGLSPGASPRVPGEIEDPSTVDDSRRLATFLLVAFGSVSSDSGNLVFVVVIVRVSQGLNLRAQRLRVIDLWSVPHLSDRTSRRSALQAELGTSPSGEAPDLPHPGAGRTWHRFGVLASWAAKDLSLGRLVEGHADALSILAECEGTNTYPRRCTYGVWAARATREAPRPLGFEEGGNFRAPSRSARAATNSTAH